MSGDYETYEWFETSGGRFRVEVQRSGTWTSYDQDGKGILTSYSRDTCIKMSRFNLESQSTNWTDSRLSDSYDGWVGQ